MLNGLNKVQTLKEAQAMEAEFNAGRISEAALFVPANNAKNLSRWSVGVMPKATFHQGSPTGPLMEVPGGVALAYLGPRRFRFRMLCYVIGATLKN